MKMKTLNCPVCGGSLVFYKSGEHYGYQCFDCPLSIVESSTPEGALNNTKQLISLFPPIMQVQIEDTVLWKSCPVMVLDKDVKVGELMVLDSYGNKHMVDQQDIDGWPWELEGGEYVPS